MGKIIKGILAVGLILLGTLTPGLQFVGPMAFLGTVSAGTLLAIGVTMALGLVAEIALAPKIPKAQLSRLNVSLDPSTPRKAVFGTTAMALDLRYHEISGSDQEYADYIICGAAHEVASIDKLYFEEKLAWDSSTGIQSTYSGYLTVTAREVGTSGNTISINGGSKWGASRRLTGCAYIHLRIKRTGNSKKTESPLVSGLPSRLTLVGEGALLYDPRLDSTVTGGSGAHRTNDQTTWGSYTNPDDCDNPALQLLWWLLGWEINGKLSVGCGVPAARIDLESFITAANICDEIVNLNGGGTQFRYRASGVATDADDRLDIINTLLATMNGTLRDSGGKLTLKILQNDLAEWVLKFNDGDILDEFKWDQTRGLSDSYNRARGRYVDPSADSLYQMVEYPEVSLPSPDGIERSVTIDLAYVEDGRRAQRIAKQILQRNQYRGAFTATFTAKAMGCAVGDVVLLSFSPLGWSNKPFRVIQHEIAMNGQVAMALVEENAAIYAWDNDESAPVTPTAPTVYDPLNHPTIWAGSTSNWSEVADDDGYRPEDDATKGAPSGTTVGGRDADTIAGTIGSDGVITADNVATDSVQDDAITEGLSDTRGSDRALGTTFSTVDLDILFSSTAYGIEHVVNASARIADTSYEGSLTSINVQVNRTSSGGTSPNTIINDYTVGSLSDENIASGGITTFAFLYTPDSTYPRLQIYFRQIDSSASTLKADSFVRAETFKK